MTHTDHWKFHPMFWSSFFSERSGYQITWEGWSATAEERRLLSVRGLATWWLQHLDNMPLWCLTGEMFKAQPTQRRPRGRPRTHWMNCASKLTRKRLEMLRRRCWGWVVLGSLSMPQITREGWIIKTWENVVLKSLGCIDLKCQLLYN